MRPAGRNKCASLPPRRKQRHNYAQANSGGFKAPQTLTKLQSGKQKTSNNKKNKSVARVQLSPSNIDGRELERVASNLAQVVLQSTPVGQAINVPGRANPTNANINASNKSLNSIVIADTEMAAFSDEKQAMRDKIAELEAKLEEKQRQEEELKKQREADEEYQQLKAKMEKLERKLSYSSPQKGKTSKSNPIKSPKSTPKLATQIPSLGDIQHLLDISEKRTASKKSKTSRKHKKTRHRSPSTSSGSTTSSETTTTSSESNSEDEEHPSRRSKAKKGKLTSGLYIKTGNAKLVSKENYAHTALDDEVGDRDLFSLSFNLFVAGELELITAKNTPDTERATRLQVLKTLAYKAEHLTLQETLNQYVSFVRKVEKGKFKWGSKTAIKTFEQQLIYNISVEARKEAKPKKLLTGGGSNKKFDDRKKYCLEYNRGSCAQTGPHEGKLNGITVQKLHICRRCLVEEGKEAGHPEKDCPKK